MDYKSGHSLLPMAPSSALRGHCVQAEEKALSHTAEIQFLFIQSRQSVEQSSKCGGISECFQVKVGQSLEGLLLYTGSRRVRVMISSDQPKGLLGLTSKAEDKGKGKGKGNTKAARAISQ